MLALVILSAFLAVAQVDLKPTPPPTISAESASWYQLKEPIVFAGNTYYPAGPQEFFNGNEMVRSGYFRGVPIYTRTTEEPYSKLYVPLSGKLLQPYERRRDGELAGTVGTSAPSFPVERSAEAAADATAGGPPQAAGPPTALEPEPVPVASAPATARPSAPAVDRGVNPATGTTGKRATTKKRAGVIAVFIEFDGRKWCSSNGGTVEYTPSRFRAIGTYHELSVYADRKDTGSTIYIPVEKSSNALLAPYTSRKP